MWKDVIGLVTVEGFEKQLWGLAYIYWPNSILTFQNILKSLLRYFLQKALINTHNFRSWRIFFKQPTNVFSDSHETLMMCAPLHYKKREKENKTDERLIDFLLCQEHSCSKNVIIYQSNYITSSSAVIQFCNKQDQFNGNICTHTYEETVHINYTFTSKHSIYTLSHTQNLTHTPLLLTSASYMKNHYILKEKTSS